MTTYYFVASFHAECCQRSHLWFQSKRGKTRERALKAFRLEIERAGREVGDIAELPKSDAIFMDDEEQEG